MIIPEQYKCDYCGKHVSKKEMYRIEPYVTMRGTRAIGFNHDICQNCLKELKQKHEESDAK